MSSDRIVTVTADPPWPWDDRLRMQPTKRGSEDQYGKMTIQEIKDLYTPSRIELQPRPRNAHGVTRQSVYTPSRLAGYDLADVGFCNLWTTATHILNGNAMDVMRHWGYEPKQIVPWIKGAPVAPGGLSAQENIRLDQLGMGWIFRSCAEFLIVGTRGRYVSLVKRHDRPGIILDELILALRPPKRGGTKHSRKPTIVYPLIEAVMPGPYLELFPGDETPAHWARWGKPRPAAAGETSSGEIHVDGAVTQASGEIVHPDTPIEWP